MAVPNVFEPEPETDEAEQLALANSYFQMVQMTAWRDLLTMLDELVDKAQQEHFSSREVDPLKIIEEKLRWQQRLLTKAAIETRVAGQLKLRDDMIEERKHEGESDEYNTAG